MKFRISLKLSQPEAQKERERTKRETENKKREREQKNLFNLAFEQKYQTILTRLEARRVLF